MSRLTAAVKAAPTCGYIWGTGVTGYSIKYAWRSSAGEGAERIVLITDRRLGLEPPSSVPTVGAAADAEFTLLEIRFNGKTTGEGKTSLTANVVVDEAARTLALDDYAAALALLRISR